MRDTEWLEQLKAGDEVVVRTGYGFPSYRLNRVDHVTPTQVVLGHHRFRKTDGRMIGGGSYNRLALVEPTPAIREKALRERLVETLGGVRWREMPTDALVRIAEIIEEAQRPTPGDASHPGEEGAR